MKFQLFCLLSGGQWKWILPYVAKVHFKIFCAERALFCKSVWAHSDLHFPVCVEVIVWTKCCVYSSKFNFLLHNTVAEIHRREVKDEVRCLGMRKVENCRRWIEMVKSVLRTQNRRPLVAVVFMKYWKYCVCLKWLSMHLSALSQQLSLVRTLLERIFALWGHWDAEILFESFFLILCHIFNTGWDVCGRGGLPGYRMNMSFHYCIQ